ncbi:MAG: AsmA family protein [Phycisphaerae bacterium]|nr:AsmA family protein [Phycisphaerae bacterium]
MTRRKRRAIFVLVLLLGIAAGGVWLFQFLGRRGSSSIERWIGQRLKQVAGAYLKPQLLFEKPDYQYPLTAVLQNLRLRVPAAAPDGAAIDILQIDRAELTFLEIPSPGEPLKIAGLKLHGPNLRLVERSGPSAGLVGFSDFLHTGPVDPSTDGTITRFSDLFHIRRLHLLAGEVRYEPRGTGARAMRLDQLDIRLNTRADESPWYRLEARTQRPPIFDLQLGGRLNVDDGRLDVGNLSLSLDLGPESIRTLPPRLQTLAEQYRVRGQLDLAGQGLLPLGNLQESRFQTELQLVGGGFDLADLTFQLDDLKVAARSANGRLHILALTARLLGGEIQATADLPPQPAPARVQLSARELDLGRLVRRDPPASGATGTDESDPAPTRAGLSGKLEGEADLSAPANAWNRQARGSGRLALTEASFSSVPAASTAHAKMRELGEWENGTAAAGSDQGYVEFSLDGDHARVEKLDIRTSLVAVRGTGEVFFDGRLNLQLNGGPLEKLQASLGPLGKVTGWLTDRLTTYEVRGTIAEPEVNLRVGGTRPLPKRTDPLPADRPEPE